MWKRTMLKKRKKPSFNLIIVALILSLTCTLFASCQKGVTSYEYIGEEFFIESGGGTYIHGEIVVPDTEEPYPLVFMAHGFKGTMNSGGAADLSRLLAAKGIGAVRIDFDNYAAADLQSGRVGSYTLTQMSQDAVRTIEYTLENYPIDKEKLGIYGRSMGGRLAMIMANEDIGRLDFKAMALIAPAGNDNAMVYYMGGEESWEAMKKKAEQEGFCQKQGLKLSADWFRDFEKYNPAETGEKFGEKPVFLCYNTLDKVVLPETSLECALAYENIEIMEVTTEDGHGYEMGFKKSQLKDEIMDNVVDFFEENLK